MAPVPSSPIADYLHQLLRRTTNVVSTATSTIAARSQPVRPRSPASTIDQDAGVTPPEDINNTAVFVLFGLIGVGFVVTGIWFFFWAKNGGFFFRENDWDEYKSTVLRRKGPNGTTLSGATESTDLGGGSIVHSEKSEKRSKWGRGKKSKKDGYSDYDIESSIGESAPPSTIASSEMTESTYKSKQQKKRRFRLRGGGRAEDRIEEGIEEEEESTMGPEVLSDLHSYRHEKPARVGGMNKASEGSAWDGSTNDGSTVVSELLSNRERTPTSTPTKPKRERKEREAHTSTPTGIRKVVSTSNGPSSTTSSRDFAERRSPNESDRIKAEAKRLQEKGRAAQRRDFSFQMGDDNSSASASLVDGRPVRRAEKEIRRSSRSPVKKVPGSFLQESDIGTYTDHSNSDLGTKSYRHVIPGLSAAGSSVAESDYGDERRKRRNGGAAGGYRRGRRDSLSDDDN